MIKKLVFLFAINCCFCHAQVADSLNVEIDSLEIEIDSLWDSSSNKISNEKAIFKSLAALRNLEENKSNKWRVLHIGDSHIQADIITAHLRKHFQNKFGNGGLGFVFPYKMAKTNGSSLFKISSDTSFENYKNIKPLDTLPVGLSGIALYTHKNNFSIELKVNDIYKFNTIKVITPENKNSLLFSSTLEFKNEVAQVPILKELPKKTVGFTTKKVHTTITHKIKKGQVLSTIAEKYNTTVSQIKKLNKLKSDDINYGKTLKIPTIVYKKTAVKVIDSASISTVSKDTIAKEVVIKKYHSLPQISSPMSHDYQSETGLNSIYIMPNTEFKKFAINGLVLENNSSGVVYSALGVNGAKCSDFNKYEAFFQQIQAVEPNLIVISFGTNESFEKLDNNIFIEQLNELIETIRLFNNDVEILVTTPQPSQFNRKYPNKFVAQYTKSILEQAEIKNYAVWDMYKSLGGASSINSNFKNGIIAADKVHYTHKGYKKQADDFYQAFLQVYESFKSTN